MAKSRPKEQLPVFPLAAAHNEDELLSLETVMERYYASIYHLSLSILDDPEEAEDIAQETFIIASE